MSGGFAHIGIVGAGAFGTALAVVAGRAGRRVTLWTRRPDEVEALRRDRENRRHLPGVPLAAAIAPTADLAAAAAADLVLFAVPAQATREAAAALAGRLSAPRPVVACAKGFERGSGLAQTAVLRACLAGCPAAALSGPGFAEEIARGLPTAVTVAAADLDLAHRLCAALGSDAFRPYASDDLAGVEVGGAAKNVLAIACGVVAGRGLGESARAALIARGLAEMTRLGVGLGARPQTFMGLSGLGDLVLTATSPRSRNTAFGMALGAGRGAAELVAAGAPLAEGAFTAETLARLARERNVEVPIIAAVAAVLAGELDVAAAIDALVRRPLKAEEA